MVEGPLTACHSSTATIKARRFNMQHVMRAAGWVEHETLTSDEFQQLLSGTDMQRVKCWTKFPDVDQPLDGLISFKLRVRQACHCLRFSPRESVAFEKALLNAVGNCLHPSALLQPLQQYALAFPSLDPDTCFVQEDKDTAACWKMAKFSYQSRI